MFPWWIPESNISAASRERERKQRGEARGLGRGQTPLIKGHGYWAVYYLRAALTDGPCCGFRRSFAWNEIQYEKKNPS